MAHEDERRGEHDVSRQKSKFADFVRLHAIEGKIITRADEKKILQEGLTRFGLDFQDAQGLLLSVAAERDIVLISHVEHHIATFIENVVKRNKISRKDFNKAVLLYRKQTNESIPESEVRVRVKQMVENAGCTGKRRRWLFGSRRWFRKI